MSQLYIHIDNPQTVIDTAANPPQRDNLENWWRNASEAEKLAAGFRPFDGLATAPEGERIVTVHTEHDDLHAWEVIDATVNLATEAAAKQASDFAANAERYSYGNAFLLLCDAVTGKTGHAKLSFEALPGVLLAIKAASRERYEDLRDAFDLINSACFKKFGLDWWDSVVWIEHPAIIDAAQKILAAIGAVKP
jgi:hypothetical protein